MNAPLSAISAPIVLPCSGLTTGAGNNLGSPHESFSLNISPDRLFLGGFSAWDVIAKCCTILAASVDGVRSSFGNQDAGSMPVGVSCNDGRIAGSGEEAGAVIPPSGVGSAGA